MHGEHLVRGAAENLLRRLWSGDAQSSIGAELKSHFRGGGPSDGDGGWWIASEVDVVYSETRCLRHDLSGWRKSRVVARPVAKRVAIRPDWVCEILSTDRNRDLVDKRRILYEHGVPHYWIVDLDGPVVTVLRHHADGYLIVNTVGPGERARLEPFQAIELEVSRLFGDIE